MATQYGRLVRTFGPGRHTPALAGRSGHFCAAMRKVFRPKRLSPPQLPADIPRVLKDFVGEVKTMTKRELVDRIRRLNPTAQPEFLAHFTEEDLLAYLHQLQEIARERRRSDEAVPVLSA